MQTKSLCHLLYSVWLIEAIKIAGRKERGGNAVRGQELVSVIILCFVLRFLR
jgi:hypothetical protein